MLLNKGIMYKNSNTDSESKTLSPDQRSNALLNPDHRSRVPPVNRKDVNIYLELNELSSKGFVSLIDKFQTKIINNFKLFVTMPTLVKDEIKYYNMFWKLSRRLSLIIEEIDEYEPKFKKSVQINLQFPEFKTDFQENKFSSLISKLILKIQSNSFKGTDLLIGFNGTYNNKCSSALKKIETEIWKYKLGDKKWRIYWHGLYDSSVLVSLSIINWILVDRIAVYRLLAKSIIEDNVIIIFDYLISRDIRDVYYDIDFIPMIFNGNSKAEIK